MGKLILLNSLRFLVLLTFQVLVFNKINLFGYLNPYPYVLFVILFPASWNIKILLTTSFLMGFWIDLSLDSGGVHALSSLLIAYNRNNIFNMFFGSTYENQTLDLKKPSSANMFKYVLVVILLHHFIVFAVSIFSFTHILDVFTRTFLSTIFTFSLVSLTLVYFKNKR